MCGFGIPSGPKALLTLRSSIFPDYVFDVELLEKFVSLSVGDFEHLRGTSKVDFLRLFTMWGFSRLPPKLPMNLVFSNFSLEVHLYACLLRLDCARSFLACVSGLSLSVPDVSRERRCLQTSPEQLKATKDKKRQKSEFPSPGGSGVSR